MSRRYYADWEDSAYPRIFAIGPGDEDGDGVTFTEARASILRQLDMRITYIRETKDEIRALRARDITTRAESLLRPEGW